MGEGVTPLPYIERATMPRLRCVSRYDNLPYGWHFKPGAEFEVTEDERVFLLSDSPGSFEDVRAEPAIKQVAKPSQDKAVKAPTRAKSTRRSK
jgi:hypothetical protein